MGAIELVDKTQMVERPQMKSGDTVRVHVKVREGDKERSTRRSFRRWKWCDRQRFAVRSCTSSAI
jgi:hypothetical protein